MRYRFKEFRPAALFTSILLILLFFHVSADISLAKGRLNYRLKWIYNASVVGDLYADTHHLFAKNGLDVNVKSGGPERDAIRELELGYAHFGTASADQVIRALAKGAPIVVIAQLFQVNALQWIYRANQPPIDHIEDLKGKVIGVTYGGNDETIMRTLLAKANIATDEVRLFSVRQDYTPFLKAKVDIWPVYRNTQGVFLKEKLERSGERVLFLDPNRFDVRFVANSVVTSRRMLTENRSTVKRFTAVLINSWKEALAPLNQEKAIAALRKHDKDTSIEILVRQLAITRRLIQPTKEFNIGTLDIPAWKQTETIMLNQGLITAPVLVEKALKPQL